MQVFITAICDLEGSFQQWTDDAEVVQSSLAVEKIECIACINKTHCVFFTIQLKYCVHECLDPCWCHIQSWRMPPACWIICTGDGEDFLAYNSACYFADTNWFDSWSLLRGDQLMAAGNGLAGAAWAAPLFTAFFAYIYFKLPWALTRLYRRSRLMQCMHNSMRTLKRSHPSRVVNMHDSLTPQHMTILIQRGTLTSRNCELHVENMYSVQVRAITSSSGSSRLPTPAIGDRAYQPSSVHFPQHEFGNTSVVRCSFQRKWFERWS